MVLEEHEHEHYTEEEFKQIASDVAKRQYWQRRPKRAADVVSQLMARSGYAQQESNEQLDEVWRQVVGKRTASKTRVGQIRRQNLEVTVENSAVLQELTFQKVQLLKKLRKVLPENAVKDLKFRVGTLR